MLHTIHTPVRWGGIDNYEHINNTLYSQYLEEAQVTQLGTFGVDLEGTAEGPVVLQSLHTHPKPVAHLTIMAAELYAGELGISSLVLEHHLYTLEDPQGTYGEGHCKLVWVRHAKNCSTPVPDSIHAAIA